MSSIPQRGSSSRKTTVTIGEGARRNTEKAILGEVRMIEPSEPTERRKKRKTGKPAKRPQVFRYVVIASILLVALGCVWLKSHLTAKKEKQAAAHSRQEIVPVSVEAD